MRTIRTFILRLLVDIDEPQTLRGMLRSVVDNEEHSFTDEQSLLALLYSVSHITGASPEECNDKENSIQTENHLK
jgi:hypothetical protein